MTKEDIEDLLIKLKPVLGEKVEKLRMAYWMEDLKGRIEVERYIRMLYIKYLKQIITDDKALFTPPPRDAIDGEYKIGMVEYNDQPQYPFGLRENEWIQHIGIFGRSGSGKTNTAMLLIANLIQHNKPFLIFDWKRNYRDLLAGGKGEKFHVLAFTIGRNISKFYFNPLIPPEGTDPKTWLKKLIEIISHAYFLGEGVMYLLQKAIDAIYKDFGIYNGKTDYPTMLDVLKWLEMCPVKGRELQWMSSTLRAVGTLCFGEMGKILNTKSNMNIPDLLNRNVIFELDALPNSDKTFFIESLLLWIHHFRLYEGQREVFKHAILIEEAHHILLRKKQEMTGEESVTDVIIREIRELGEAIILIDQHPSLISIPACSFSSVFGQPLNFPKVYKLTSLPV